jgi:hypothetical protein
MSLLFPTALKLPRSLSPDVTVVPYCTQTHVLPQGLLWITDRYSRDQPITVASRSKAWTIFARSNAAIVGSNPTQGMDVCVRLFCVCVVLCVGNGLATGWSLVQGVLRNWRRGQGPRKGCRVIDEWMNNSRDQGIHFHRTSQTAANVFHSELVVSVLRPDFRFL